MFPRHLQANLLERAAKMPVVTVIGPRQSGKTTWVRAAFPGHRYLSRELPPTRLQAHEDPASLLKGDAGVILVYGGADRFALHGHAVVPWFGV